MLSAVVAIFWFMERERPSRDGDVKVSRGGRWSFGCEDGTTISRPAMTSILAVGRVKDSAQVALRTAKQPGVAG